jgi:hypothetical protein
MEKTEEQQEVATHKSLFDTDCGAQFYISLDPKQVSNAGYMAFNGKGASFSQIMSIDDFKRVQEAMKELVDNYEKSN